ncbi:hypothetical protein PENTCL1PPCAC_15887, partial [Pristionchus entomophagus]
GPRAINRANLFLAGRLVVVDGIQSRHLFRRITCEKERQTYGAGVGLITVHNSQRASSITPLTTLASSANFSIAPNVLVKFETCSGDLKRVQSA